MPNHPTQIARELLSHQAFLRRLAIDLVGDDADDLVQEVWQRALERPPHHVRQLRGWLARVARNLATSRWRGEASRTEREASRASEHVTTDELESRLELRKELVAALDALSPSCRETILLRYFEGLAPRDIARRQETPVATVKTRLRRGLAQLRETLDKRCDGDRASWMSAITALAAPAGNGGSGTLAIGGIAMGTTMKVSAAALAVAAGVYLVARPSESASEPRPAVPTPAGGELADVALESGEHVVVDPIGAEPVSRVDGTASEVARRNPVVEDVPSVAGASAEDNVLRVVLEGITDVDARMATITLTGVDDDRTWPDELRASWSCQAVASELDLDPFFASVERHDDLEVDELDVEVDHPHHLRAWTRVPLSGAVRLANGKTVHEVRMRLVRPEFWPAFSLSVRDAETRAHLDDVELSFLPGALSSMWGQLPISAVLASGLHSPIALMGGRAPDETLVAGLALSPTAAESPRLVELARRMRLGRGVVVSARAPGYAWGSISLDVTKSGERELLLRPGSALDVRLANVRLDRYAALEAEPMLCIYWIREDGGDQYVRFARLDEKLEIEGLRLEGLNPGGYAVSVELGGEPWTKRPVLAREKISLEVGRTGELLLELADPPDYPVRANLGGVVSIPDFGSEGKVRLTVYEVGSDLWGAPPAELSLADMKRVGGELPTWYFRVDDLPIGLYQAKLWPFQKSWMIELPDGGREDVELVIPELAEVLVETVDARTGERVPAMDLKYGSREVLPDQVNNRFAWAELEEPGLFRFWAAPGPAFFQTNRMPSEYGWCRKDLELVAGLQSVRLEVGPAYLIRFEFRVDGAVLRGPEGFSDWVRYGMGAIRAVDHDGRALGTAEEQVMEVTAPGIYEIDFAGVGGDRFHPTPPRIVEVRAGEMTDVIVELERK